MCSPEDTPDKNVSKIKIIQRTGEYPSIMTLKQKNLNNSEVTHIWKQTNKNDSLFVNTPWDESQHIKKKFLDLD